MKYACLKSTPASLPPQKKKKNISQGGRYKKKKRSRGYKIRSIEFRVDRLVNTTLYSTSHRYLPCLTNQMEI